MMKRFVSFIFLIVLSVVWAFGFLNYQANAQTPAARKNFVLLELYTSEGCPTCPPADANLALLEREQPFPDTEIIALALHVDYWNSVVWKDTYSSPLFSRRQQLYSQALKSGENYTPQMVVDGRAAFIGSNLAKARKTISEAAKTPKATIVATPVADALKIKISGVPVHENATVFLAVTEDDLASNRKNGSPSDKDPKHISVVRSLTTIEAMSAAQSDLELQTALQLQPEWKREKLKIVIFVQENVSRKVLGVNRVILN